MSPKYDKKDEEEHQTLRKTVTDFATTAARSHGAGKFLISPYQLKEEKMNIVTREK